MKKVENKLPKHLRTLAAARLYVVSERVKAVDRRFYPGSGDGTTLRDLVFVVSMLFLVLSSLAFGGLVSALLFPKMVSLVRVIALFAACSLPFLLTVCFAAFSHSFWKYASERVTARKEALREATDPVAVHAEAVALLRAHVCPTVSASTDADGYRDFNGSPVRVLVDAAADACVVAGPAGNASLIPSDEAEAQYQNIIRVAAASR